MFVLYETPAGYAIFKVITRWEEIQYIEVMFVLHVFPDFP